jgi:methanethiol S-methyltransferase
MPQRDTLKAAAATAAFAAAHSALASLPAKAAAGHVAGRRVRNGLYRPLYNLVAVLTFGWLTLYVRGLHGRTLYRVRGPLSWLMRLGQAASLLYAYRAARAVGIARFAGLPGLWALLSGEEHVPAEPEAQGPRLDEATGRVRTAGPFATSRQPLNFVVVPLLWLNPRMTTNLAAVSLVSTLYLYLGSLHSEYRLRRAYGPAYEAYRRSGIPFFLPAARTRSIARGTAATTS